MTNRIRYTKDFVVMKNSSIRLHFFHFDFKQTYYAKVFAILHANVRISCRFAKIFAYILNIKPIKDCNL